MDEATATGTFEAFAQPIGLIARQPVDLGRMEHATIGVRLFTLKNRVTFVTAFLPELGHR